MTEKARQLGNEPASPTTGLCECRGQIIGDSCGATKREVIATVAMWALMSDGETEGGPGTFARMAVEYADALLEELCKPVEQPKTENP